MLLLSQADSRVQQSQDEKNEDTKAGQRLGQIRKSRRGKLSLRLLDRNRGMAANAGVLEKVPWRQNVCHAALTILNLDDTVAADNELLASENTRHSSG